MKKQLWLYATVAMFLSFSGFAQKIDRTKVPQGGTPPKIQLGKSQSFTLANGLKVYVVTNNKLPQLAVSLVFDNTEVLEGEAAGYVDMAGQMLLRGTSKRAKEKIDSEIDFIGATISTSANGAYAFGLKKHAEKIFDLMADGVINPTFPQEELDKLKKETLSGLKASENDPSAISRNLLATVRFGNKHPYGEIVTSKTVEKVTVDLLKQYHSTYFKPNVAYMAILGDIDVKTAKTLTEKYFGKWQKADVPKNTFTTPTAPAKAEVAMVDKTGAVQTVLALTNTIDLQPNSPDMIKVRLMNQLLGGAGARLYLNLREDKGYTYGAYSRISQDKLVGNFTASASVRTAVTDSAVTEFLNELNRIRTEDVKEEELKRIKAVMTGDFVRSLEDPQTIANFAINTARYNMPADYYQNYLKNLEAVTVADVKAMANKYIKPENMFITAVGDLKEIEPKLAKFGKSTVYDNYGNIAPKADANALAGVSGVEVLEKYLKAIGGKEKLATIKSLQMSSVAEMMGIKITITQYRKAPNKFAMVQATPMGEAKQVFDGEKAVMDNPMQGKKTLEGKEVENLKALAAIFPELNAIEQKYAVEVTNIVKVEDKEAYEVTITTPGGAKMVNCYDKATGLLVQMVTMGNKLILGDYREVNGVKFPYSSKAQTQMGNMEFKVEKVETNVTIADSIFAVN